MISQKNGIATPAMKRRLVIRRRRRSRHRSAYRAACTPEFYVFDKEQKLAYRGRFDESNPGNDVPTTGNEVRAALECCL